MSERTYTTAEAHEFELSRINSKAQTLRRLESDSALGRGCGLHDIAKDLEESVSNLRKIAAFIAKEAVQSTLDEALNSGDGTYKP